jgi:YidC/Oxa1 family membrane protein insertase
MDQTRMIVAVVLTILVFSIWQLFFGDRKAVKPAVNEEPVVQVFERAVENKNNPEVAGEVQEPSQVKGAAESYKTPKIISIDTPLYQVLISEKGAVFQSFKLKNYREAIGKDAPPKELIDPKISMGSMRSGFTGHSVPGVSEAVYSTALVSHEVSVTDQPVIVPFLWRSKDGVIIEKSFIFRPDTYLIDLSVSINNGSGAAIQDKMTISMMDTISKKKSRMGFSGPSAMVDNRIEEIKQKELAENISYSGNITWAAFQDQYFMSSIIPTIGADASVGFHVVDETLLESRLVMPEKTIPPSGKEVYSFQAYFGPKNISILKEVGHRLEKVVDFGWFDFLARPALWVMNYLYRFIPNYGLDIILLTIFIKIVLWPLGNKSYKSMSQMKKMQPLMAEIRERYKDDKQKMNMEVMSLYKTYKVNPLGGCLPMIAQLPVFFAFYRMLYQAVELRHAPFVGWITDLSAPDRLFDLGIRIPYMEPPYGIPVLTIIMGATMFLQQKMQPPMGDPAQAKMMMFMPIIFTVIFVNFSSGLVLYWLVNNILSILQQYYVTKKTT